MNYDQDISIKENGWKKITFHGQNIATCGPNFAFYMALNAQN